MRSAAISQQKIGQSVIRFSCFHSLLKGLYKPLRQPIRRGMIWQAFYMLYPIFFHEFGELLWSKLWPIVRHYLERQPVRWKQVTQYLDSAFAGCRPHFVNLVLWSTFCKMPSTSKRFNLFPTVSLMANGTVLGVWKHAVAEGCIWSLALGPWNVPNPFLKISLWFSI